MDERELLEKSINKLTASLKVLQKDPRCNRDNEFENAVQKLNAFIEEQSQKLTDLETDYFKDKSGNFKDEIIKLENHADHLQNSLDNAQDAVQIIGAIEAIIKVFHPVV